jgi:hypothetical protein
MAIEIYDLGSTVSILNDGEYTIITKQDASITLNGSIVALIDFSGQRYEYNFADVTVPSEASGADLAATLNEYLQSTGGGGGGGVESVTGNVVGGTSTNPTVNIGGNANQILYKNGAGVITGDANATRTADVTEIKNEDLTPDEEAFSNVRIQKDGVAYLSAQSDGNDYYSFAGILPLIATRFAALFSRNNANTESNGVRVNPSVINIFGKVASADFEYNLPRATPTANQILKANSTTPTQLEWADGEIIVKVSLSAAQIKTANSIPINIGLPASGAGFYYRVVNADVRVDYNSIQFTNTTLYFGSHSTGASQREFNQLAVAYDLFKPTIESVVLTSSIVENGVINIWSESDSAVGNSTIDCYITVVKVAL